MNILIASLLTIAGLVLIVFCANWFLDSAIWIAKKAKIPTLIIGATIVSVGTTLPELLVSHSSAFTARRTNNFNFYSIAVGNSLGSMISNILLILGISMFFAPGALKGKNRNKIFYLLTITLFLAIFLVFGSSLALWESILLIIGFIAFMTINVVDAVKNKDDEEGLEAKNLKWYTAIILLVVGAAGIAVGSHLLVNNAEKLAVAAHIPAAVIASTIVAIGTSLPELVTTITAIKKKTVQLGIGNIIGANIINSTLILGGVGLIAGRSLPIDYFSLHISLYFLIAATFISMLPLLFKNKSYKWQGAVLLLIFIGYMSANLIYSLL